MSPIINLSALSGSSVFSNSEDKWYEKVSYEDSKDLIREKINSAKSSLVSIGYYLKHIKKNELFKEDGYANIHDFAKAEFGFSDNTTDRYMQLNDQFSVGGNSPEIEDKYSTYNMSQLFEMLPLKEEERESISSDMTVKEIRQAKKEIKASKVLKDNSAEIDDSIDFESDIENEVDEASSYSIADESVEPEIIESVKMIPITVLSGLKNEIMDISILDMFGHVREPQIQDKLKSKIIELIDSKI